MKDAKTGRIDPTLLIDAVWKRWRLLIIPMVVCPVLAVAARQFVGPNYKSSAQVLVQEAVQINPVLKDLVSDIAVKSRLPEISSIVRSRQTVEKVLRELGEVDDSMTPQEVLDRVEAFRRRIQVYSEGAGLIRIALTGGEAEHVFRGVQLLTAALIDEMVRPQREALSETQTFLREKIRAIRVEIDALEEQERKIVEANPDYLPEVRHQKLEALKDLRTQLRDVEADLHASRQAAQAIDGKGTAFSPAYLRNSRSLRVARRELEKLRGTLTDAHPKVQAAVEEVDRLEAERARLRRSGKTTVEVDETSKEDEELLGSVDAHQARVKFLNEQVTSLLKDIQSFADYEQTVKRIRRELEDRHDEASRLQERLRQAQLRLDLVHREQANDIRVVEEPTWPDVSAKYRLRFVLAGGLFGGILLGLSLVFGLEFLDRTVRTPSEAEKLASAPVLGTMPG